MKGIRCGHLRGYKLIPQTGYCGKNKHVHLSTSYNFGTVSEKLVVVETQWD